MVTQKKDISAGLSLGGIVPKYSTLKTLKGLLFDSPDNIGGNLTANQLYFSSLITLVVNVHKLGGLEKDGPWVATTDSPILMGFDPVTLETEGLVKSPDLIASKGGIPLFSTAHPKAQGGYTYNYFLELRPIPFLHNGNLAHIVRIDPSLRQKIVGTVNLGKDVVPYVHDISITDRYAILIIWPLFFDLSKMLDSKGLFPNMNYKPDITSKIYVFDISKCVDGEEGVNSSVEPVARFESDPLVAYHHINAFEEAGNVVVDVTAYRKPDIITGEHGFSYPDQLKDPALRVKQERLGNCFRWTLPVDQVKGTSEFVRVAPLELKAFDEAGLDYSYELVRISPLTGGRRHRYSYGYSSWAGTGPDRGAYLEWGIVKLDHQAAEARAQSMQGVEEKGKKEGPSTAQIWRAPSCFPGEPVFVPDPGAETGNEDAGALVSIVFDAARKESFLLVLDAHTMEELARCYIGMPLPYSFHGEIYFDPK